MRALTVLLLVLGLSAPVFAQDVPRIAPRPLESALSAMQSGRWDQAKRVAERDGKAAVELIEWFRLREGRGTPEEVVAFLNAHPAWPGLARLRREQEDRLEEAGDALVLDFFEGARPLTGTGTLRYVRALKAAGQDGEAAATLVLAWRTMDLTTPEHNAFLEDHADLLKPHHEARLDMALWRGLRDVQQMLPLVPEKTRERAKIRQDLETGRRTSLDGLTEAAKQDAGIAYAMFNRYIDSGRTDSAIDLILKHSQLEKGLGEADRWAGWRRYIARSQMREGNAQTAYDLASGHGLVDGSNFADLEWLSGYLALTYLNAPDLALDHFQRFRGAVETPISLGRAGYWIGRAQEALGDPEAAQLAYAFGADYQTSFYGLLAAERAGLPPDPALGGTKPEPGADAAFRKSELYQAAVLLRATGRLSLSEMFFTALAETLDPPALEALGHALDRMEEPHLQVMVGKTAAGRGIVIPGPYYALHPLHEMDLPVPRELALAIARRESEFDPNVVSGAGAQGLMQLMPGTASDVARAIGVSHDRNRVLSDWRYNATLGSAYLQQMSRRFDGNVVMVSAAYNAGPGRPLRWMEEYGDPRQGDIDVIDWIEHIPFRETQNYVMRVAESLPIYRARLGLPPHPMPFSEELTGKSLILAVTD